MKNNFIYTYSAILAASINADFADNYDKDRFGPIRTEQKSWKERLLSLLEKVGLTSSSAKHRALKDVEESAVNGLKFIEPYLIELEWLYNKLSDEESCDILLNITAYRALGYRKIKLPTNTPEFWKARDLALQIPIGKEEIDPKFMGWKLHERSLEKFGYPIRMFCGEGACYTTFVHEQYRCVTSEGIIECSEGDIAVDAGGCYGDTALYLAHKAGAKGRVASFEFLPINVSVFRRNMELNPLLATKIRLYENPVYSVSGQELFVLGNGPGTQVVHETKDQKAIKIKTIAIDDLVTTGDFPQIDFIKMDIEGSELEALKGAESVLRKFKPKLAITVYHDFKDFWTIPQYLDSLGLGYRFYLRHFTIHAEETVLFAATGTRC
jgi:FkbM family methyltransferase